ncbi:adenylate and guanylate cyclase catalytic domain protein [mine drainage metagenome]|uniref:Adenylate and guanylate cyclase catalytic domain protein n=1 Tax=mine drainage metagenome TaxID=410659 RepID=A0A1J5R9U1_9ZZZZ
MIDRLNKTSICSIVFLDIIGYSKKSVSEQIDDKTLFNELINEAIKNVAQNDRIILDTGDGAAITLMGEPEEALFISLTIRDGILLHNKSTGQSLRVRIGINLGSVRVVNDINDRPNIVGDGINVAQRIMSFAGENEILVSRSYYEVTSRLTKEMSGMFTYSGVKHDKHIREHEVYVIKPIENDENNVAVSDFSSNKGNIEPPVSGNKVNILNRMLLASMVLLAGFIVLYFITNQFKSDSAGKEKSAHETVENNANHTRAKKTQSVKKCSQAESVLGQCR